MIEVKNLHKSFGDQSVLKGLDIVMHTGKCNLIIGSSGSGKTAMLKSMLGLLHPEAGSIAFDGRDILSMVPQEARKLRQEMGMVFQGSALFTSSTIAENVKMPLDFFTSLSEEEKMDRVHFCLDRVRIENAAQKFPAELSGGMQKRVAIARAIVLNPKYLFCDEPNSGLDPETAMVIDNLIQDITQEYGMTTIVNTHDMNSVLEIGEHVMLLKGGLKVWEGSKEEILRADTPDVQDYVFRSHLMKRVREALRG